MTYEWRSSGFASVPTEAGYRLVPVSGTAAEVREQIDAAWAKYAQPMLEAYQRHWDMEGPR